MGKGGSIYIGFALKCNLMYLIPLLFSFILMIIVYKRNGFDLGFFVSFVYFMSSLCACILIKDQSSVYLEDYANFKITLIPTILYVVNMFFSIYPLYVFNTNKLRPVNITINNKYLDYIILLFFLVLLLMVLLFGSTIPERLVLSNMKEFRSMNYIEDTSIISGFSFSKKILALLTIGLSVGASALLVFFYFCLAFTNRSKKYLIVILALSMLPIFNGILNMDRSNVFYWVLLFMMSFFLFKPYLTPANRAFIYRMSLCVIGVLLVYFIAVSIARFNDSDSGTLNALIDYIGQPYLNFCNEWNSIVIKGYSIADIFHIFKLFPQLLSQVEIINVRSIATNGFHTFAGSFLYTLGHWGVVIIPFILYLFLMSFSKRRARKLDIKTYMILFLVFTIPQTSIISYYYANEWRFIDIFLFIYFAQKLKKVKLRKTSI